MPEYGISSKSFRCFIGLSGLTSSKTFESVSAHHLLQVRTQVLNDDFYQLFCKWYPGMVEPSVSTKREKAA